MKKDATAGTHFHSISSGTLRNYDKVRRLSWMRMVDSVASSLMVI